DIKIRIERPDARAAREIFLKYLLPSLPYHPEELAKDNGDAGAMVGRLADHAVDQMYSTKEENEYLEVTYANGEKEMLYFKDFISGALIEGVVSRAKKYAIKRIIATGQKGIRGEDLLQAARDEFREHEDLPNTTQPDEWAKIAGKKGEKIVHVRTIGHQQTESKRIETISTGHYL
ncbi:MAG TPA: proteasome ATPase, partial [Nitrospiria bacterium]